MADNITFGYVRVSSDDQNEARQVEKMRELGIDERHIFIDKKRIAFIRNPLLDIAFLSFSVSHHAIKSKTHVAFKQISEII
jgi:hypothetical protein